MIRGTTAPFLFNIPNSFGTVNKIQAVFWQKGNSGTTAAPMPIIKIYNNLEDTIINDGFAIESDSISVALSPAETLRFLDTLKAYAQIKIYNENQNVTYASRSQKFTVYPIENTDLLEDIGSAASSYEGFLHIDGGNI